MSNDFNRSLLHEERIKKGLSITALAQAVGVNQSMISKWESGVAKPRMSSIKKLCEFFEVEPDYWAHFYHEPQKPLESFTPTQYAREEAKKAFNAGEREVDKEKVKENLAKLNNKVADEIDAEATKKAAIQIIKELEERIKAKDTEIQGLKCELEGLKVENANLKGNIEGLTTQLLLKDDDTKQAVHQSIWQRMFG